MTSKRLPRSENSSISALRDAREKGSALAIGHPHPETLQVLEEMLPNVEREGVTLVFASNLVR